MSPILFHHLKRRGIQVYRLTTVKTITFHIDIEILLYSGFFSDLFLWYKLRERL